MPGLGRRTFNAGEVLTAANVQGYLQDQAVMVFGGTAARSSAIPTPSEGMVTYRSDQDVVEFYTGAIWKSTSDEVVSYNRNTAATLTLTTTTETSFMTGPAFTPVAGRLYEVTVTCGYVQKTTGTGNVVIRLRKDTVSGTELDLTLYSAQPVSSVWMHSKTGLITSTQMGTSSFVPVVTAQTNTNGLTIANTGNYNGAITFKDIGAV